MIKENSELYHRLWALVDKRIVKSYFDNEKIYRIELTNGEKIVLETDEELEAWFTAIELISNNS
jgi:hypothetical protein